MSRQKHTYEEKDCTQTETGRAQLIDLSKASLSPKLLHRFYEPLGLLSALGKARDKHTHKSLPPFEQANSMTAQQLRHQFLDELAFLCDHKKGGDSCTAIALGQTSRGCVFWVAANKCPQRLIVPFLSELLKILKKDHGEGDGQLLVGEVVRICVTFARERIVSYAKHLSMDLERLKGFLACTDEAAFNSISIWENMLRSIEKDDPCSLVEFAYTNRHSEFTHQLATLAYEQRYNVSGDGLQATCTSARHHIGRLGLHARSARALASYAPRMMAFLESYSVQAVPVPIEGNGRPPPRKSTNVEAALTRMLPTDAPELKSYRQSLALVDKSLKISERFLNDYSDSKNRTKVHAEVQVLHHFDQNDEKFVGDDKYIACSKSTCFCCHLYFRHHPKGFVVPNPNHKIYLNWQPPDMRSAKKGRENQLRDIMNLMIKDIRKEALNQLIQKAALTTINPDPMTGVSLSILASPRLGAISITAHEDQKNDAPTNVGIECSSLKSDNAAASSSSAILPDLDEDTDEEEGGISLLGIEEAFSD